MEIEGVYAHGDEEGRENSFEEGVGTVGGRTFDDG